MRTNLSNATASKLNDQDEKISNHKKVFTSLVAGATAGATAKTSIAPLDRAKIYFQVSHTPYTYRGVLTFLTDTVKVDGVLHLWRGNSATMARVIPFAAIQFSAHEQWKTVLHVDTRNRDLNPMRRYLAGSLAGVTATTATYPLDLARARMAITNSCQYRNIFQVFLKILRGEGWRSLYRGFVPTMIGVVPYAGTSFFTYETLKKFHRDRQAQPRPLSPFERLTSGALAGLLGQTTSYPLDIVRRRMQTAGVTGGSYKTVMSTFMLILKREGVRRGLFKGMTMNWIKGPIAVSVSFTTFDVILIFLRKKPVVHDR